MRAGRSSCGSARALLGAGCALVLGASAAHAQGETGFLRGRGHLDLVLTYREDSYDEILPDGSDAVDVIRRGVDLYGAYGVRDDLDLTFDGTYLKSDLTEDPLESGAEDEEGFQDMTAAVKWRASRWSLGTGELALLMNPRVKFPMSDYENTGLTSLGGGQVDIEGHVVLHWQPATVRYYAAFDTGYDWRLDDTPDEVPLNVVVGYRFGNWLWVTPFYTYVFALGSASTTPTQTAGGGGRGRGGGGDPPGGGGGAVGKDIVGPGGVDYERVGINGYLRLTEHLGFSGGFQSTDDGRGTGSIPGWNFGIVVRF